MKRFVISSLLTAAACLTTALADPVSTGGLAGAVYTMDNSSTENHVLVFARAASGQLTWTDSVATGGKGTGSGLGSQGALLLSNDGHWLFACNAGSDEISVFSASNAGLELTGKVGSQGHVPISLTLAGNLLYVVNAGGSVGDADNIAGFIFANGQLTPLTGSARALSDANTGPAQISFTADNQVLVVTEKATSRIDTFVLGSDGLVQDQKIFASPASTPFGFASGRHDHIFVSNAPSSSLSSYAIADDGDVEVISNAVPNNQAAACWVALSRDERFAYTANAASGSISGYRVAPDGSVELLSADGQTGITGAGSHPIDLALSRDSRYLYSLDSGTGTITIFRAQADGSLDSVPGVSGISKAASGLAAR